MTLAQELADFTIRTSFDDLPGQAVEHAAMLVASTFASAALGSTLESARIVREIEIDRGGRAESTIWFSGGPRVPIQAAARANALASDAAASDDSDLRTIVHQGTTACACALAVAETTDASGRDLLAAIVLGYEIAGRFSTAMLHGYKEKGFHNSIIAAFAGTVAATRLMRLPREQTANAIALTATSVGGISAAANTSCVREYDAGNAAMLAIEAARAAARGFTAEPAILEMKGGYFDLYGGRSDVAAMTRDLGRRWCILDHLGIKLVPGGTPYHAIAEAAAAAAIAGDMAPEDVVAIDVARPGYQGFGYAHTPTDLIGIAHSPAYFAAAGVADRRYGWEHALPKKIGDPRIRALLPRVRLVAPPTEDLDRFQSGAVVTIETRDGKRHTSTIHAPRGAASRGIAWADIEAKFRALLPFGGVSAVDLEAGYALVRDLKDAASAATLLRHVRGRD